MLPMRPTGPALKAPDKPGATPWAGRGERLALRLSRRCPDQTLAGPVVAPPSANWPVRRLGLPWRLPHYRPLNGPHPLVMSFLHGNAGVEAIDLSGAAHPTDIDRTSVVRQVARQARPLTPMQSDALIDWLHLSDQFSIEAQRQDCEALFLHTTPLYAGTKPWVFHFESFPSLFMPYMFTGDTLGIDLPAQPFFTQVRDALASDTCQRIVSHMRGSLQILSRVFDHPAITAKCRHVPLGIACQPAARALAKFDTDGPLKILFTNSMHGHPGSFYLRGGHHLLEAVARLRQTLPDLTLTVLSRMPADLDTRVSAGALGGVNWIDSGIDDGRLEQLYLDHHLFALPAAGLHSFSLLRAWSHGCVPIVSDAPGYEEYVDGLADTVLQIRGVRKMVYRDEAAGWTSDDYAPFVTASTQLSSQIHDRVLENAALSRLKAMARLNLEHCRQHYQVAASHAAFNAAVAVQASGIADRRSALP